MCTKITSYVFAWGGILTAGNPPSWHLRAIRICMIGPCQAIMGGPAARCSSIAGQVQRGPSKKHCRPIRSCRMLSTAHSRKQSEKPLREGACSASVDYIAATSPGNMNRVGNEHIHRTRTSDAAKTEVSEQCELPTLSIKQSAMSEHRHSVRLSIHAARVPSGGKKSRSIGAGSSLKG